MDEILDLIESVSTGFRTYSWCIISEKIIDKYDFPYHYKNIIVRFKKIDDNIHVSRQTACLVVIPIKVNSFAYLFNCTTGGRASD